MTKAELIESLKDFPDDMLVMAQMDFDWGSEDQMIDFVEYCTPYSQGKFLEDKKFICLRLY